MSIMDVDENPLHIPITPELIKEIGFSPGAEGDTYVQVVILFQQNAAAWAAPVVRLADYLGYWFIKPDSLLLPNKTLDYPKRIKYMSELIQEIESIYEQLEKLGYTFEKLTCKIVK